MRVQISLPHEESADRVNQLLLEYRREMPAHEEKEESRRMSRANHLMQNGWRKWLCRKGKGYLVHFDRRERQKLKEFFNALDTHKCGYLTVDQLEEMLLGLGLAKGFEEIKRLVKNVELAHPGRI